MVTITTLVVGNSSFIALVAASPSISGILTSISTRSGCNWRHISRASLPFLASPTTSRSGSPSRTASSPSLTRSWSSAINTLAGSRGAEEFASPRASAPDSPFIGLTPHGRYAPRLGQRHLCQHLGAGSRLATDPEASTEQGDPLPHAREPNSLARPISRHH